MNNGKIMAVLISAMLIVIIVLSVGFYFIFITHSLSGYAVNSDKEDNINLNTTNIQNNSNNESLNQYFYLTNKP